MSYLNLGASSLKPFSTTTSQKMATTEDVSLFSPVLPNHGSSTTPTPPPQMESVRSRTADEIVEMMGRTPLFMTSLDQAGAEGQ